MVFFNNLIKILILFTFQLENVIFKNDSYESGESVNRVDYFFGLVK